MANITAYACLGLVVLAMYLATRKDISFKLPSLLRSKPTSLETSAQYDYFTKEFFEKKFGGTWLTTATAKKTYKKRVFRDVNQLIEVTHDTWLFNTTKQALTNHKNKMLKRGKVETGDILNVMEAIENPPAPIDALPVVFMSRGPNATMRAMLTKATSEILGAFEIVIMVFSFEETVHRVSIVVRDPEHKIEPITLAQQAAKEVLTKML